MVSFKESDVWIFVHIPDVFDHYGEHVLDQIRLFLDACEMNDCFLYEEWYMTDDYHPYSERKLYTKETKNEWSSYKKEMEQIVCHGNATVYYQMPKNKKKMSIFFTVNRSNKYTNPIIKNERTIEIRIPKAVAKQIGMEMLLIQMRDLCHRVHATYAFMDLILFMQRSIYHDSFRCWGQNNVSIDPETRIPGIHWLQFLSEKMVSNTDTLENIAANAPCTKAIVDREGLVPGVWLQLSNNLWKEPPPIYNEYRKYFEKSMYELDLYEVAKCFPERDILLQYLPLSQEEREQMMAIRIQLPWYSKYYPDQKCTRDGSQCRGI